MTDRLEQIVAKIPGFSAALKAAQQEALGARAAAIEQARKHREEAERTESDLAAAAAGLNSKAAALREQLAAVERAISANAAARNATRWSADGSIRALHAQLRSEVEGQVTELQAQIVSTREALHSGFDNARAAILGTGTASNQQVVAALATLLAAYTDAESMAVCESDIAAAFTQLRQRLANAGIRLLQPSSIQ